MFKRFLATLRDYFGFSQKEARRFTALLALVAFVLLLPWLYNWLIPADTPDTYAADQRKLDSLLTLMNEQPLPTPDKREYGANEAEEAQETASPAQRFAFDPNTISEADWQRLGVPRWLAQRIGRYRQKGGQFRKKEDLLRIYDFPPDLYAEIEPYIRLQSATHEYASAKPKELMMKSEQAAFTPGRYERSARISLQPFDINTADTSQLIRLKGIGGKLAARIVKFRDAMGGFVSTEQFNDIFGLDSLARQELQQYARIQTPVRKIPINTASAEELDRHPFLSRRQAEIIIRYREQHGAFKAADDLKGIRILDERTIAKIAPYLSFE